MITVVWIISAVISFPPLLMTKHDELECLLNNETWYILSSCMVSFFAPCLIMILVYCKIYRVAKQRASTVFVAKNGMQRQPSQSETCFVRKGKSETGSPSSHSSGSRERKGELDDIDLEESTVSNRQRTSRFAKSRKVGGCTIVPKAKWTSVMGL